MAVSGERCGSSLIHSTQDVTLQSFSHPHLPLTIIYSMLAAHSQGRVKPGESAVSNHSSLSTCVEGVAADM